jgi:carboxylesterase
VIHPVIEGAEPVSHVAAGEAGGVLALHGFTGNPSSLGRVVDAAVAAGLHVEVPRLPGHGTSVEDMLATRWEDWSAAAVEALRRLLERTDRAVVMGQSMGGTLALWTALHDDTRAVRGLVLVNPLTVPQPDDVRQMIGELLAEGTTVAPGIGSDIADPAVVETAYPGTPLAPLISLLDEGLVPLADRYGELSVPMLLFTSRQDHVVDPAQSEYLARAYGGGVDHRWLERSYHVATIDYDRDEIAAATVEFAARRLGGP